MVVARGSLSVYHLSGLLSFISNPAFDRQDDPALVWWHCVGVDAVPAVFSNRTFCRISICSFDQRLSGTASSGGFALRRDSDSDAYAANFAIGNLARFGNGRSKPWGSAGVGP